MKRLATLSTAVCLLVPTASAEGHYTGGCKKNKCKRHVVQPYKGWLRSVRACEVRGQPFPFQTNTGNGFYGAYQFTVRSWYAVGGKGMPHLNRPLEQSYRAVKLLFLQGRGAWPVCG